MISNNNQPAQDILTVVSSLVQHDMPVGAVDGSKKFRTIVGPNIGNEDAPNFLPLLFSIGTDNVLYFLTIQDGASSNWSSYDLTSVLGSGMQVTTFEVTQDSQTNYFVIFLAVTDGKGTSHFYKTRVLTTAFDGKVDAEFWSELAISQEMANSVINTISASNRTVILTTKREGTSTPAKYYCFNLDDNSCSECTLPTYATEIYKVAAGQFVKPGTHAILEGYFVFYNTGDHAAPVKAVIFQPRTDPLIVVHAIEYHFSADFRSSINDIFVLPAQSADQSSILYAAGDQGVVECPSSNTLNVIIAPTAGMSYKQIVVAATGSNTSVFLVQESDTQLKFLSQTTNYFTDDKSWSPPVVVATDIVEFDTIFALGSANNQILAVTNANSLQHLIQDTATGAWAASPILVANPDKHYSVSGFAAFVTLNVPEGTSSVGQPLFIKADIDATILVNNASYRVGPTTTAEIILQSNNLYIEYLADALDCPVLFVTSPLFTAGNKAAIDLEAGIYNELRKLKSAAALKAAGNDLIPDVGAYSNDFLNNFADVLQNLIDLRSNLINQALQKAFASSASNETSIQATPQGDLVSLIAYLGRQAFNTFIESALFSTLGFCMLTASLEIAMIYFTPDPNAIKLSLESSPYEGTFRIESHTMNRQLKIDNPQAARKATKYLFRTVNSKDENTKKKYKKEYKCDIKIDIPIDDLFGLNTEPVLACAIGAKVGVKITTTIDEVPQVISSSMWIISGRQIDTSLPLSQSENVGVGFVVPIRIAYGTLKDIGRNYVQLAWLETGIHQIDISGTTANGTAINYTTSFTVYGPTLLERAEGSYCGPVRISRTEIKKKDGTKEMVDVLTEDIFCPSQFYIPRAPGPNGTDVLIGGSIGFLQVIAGYYTDSNSIYDIHLLTHHTGKDQYALDMAPNDLFYIKADINESGTIPLMFYDGSAVVLPPAKSVILDRKQYDQHSADLRFEFYAAFKAPVNPRLGIIESYIIIQSGSDWGWTGACQAVVGNLAPEWQLTNVNVVPNQLVPNRAIVIQPHQYIAKLWNCPEWIDNAPNVYSKYMIGPAPIMIPQPI